MITIAWSEYVRSYYVRNDYWTEEFVQQMVTKGFITKDEYEAAKAERAERIQLEAAAGERQE